MDNISVIIRNRNEERYIGYAIQSVLDTFDKPEKGVTVFYGRDRGEKGNMSTTWKNRDAVKFKSGEEYGYVWSVKDKKWYYKSRYSNPQNWTPLKWSV